MRKFFLVFLTLATMTLGIEAAQALQCVPYARSLSGVSLKGDAWTWWQNADGLYEKGSKPQVGSVMVFKKTGAMRRGHVAVVSKVLSDREILIDHANWGSGRIGGRGGIARNAAVIDVSPANDWSEVRVAPKAGHEYGVRVNPVYGFIHAKRPIDRREASASGSERGQVAEVED